MSGKSQNLSLSDDFGGRPRRQPDEVRERVQNGDTTWCGPENNRRLRVLVADDCRDTADSLARLITLWGHEVWIAYDGAAALAMASDCQADVVLLDVTMPKIDGFEVARRLRRQGRFAETVPVAITGWADQAHGLLGEAAGFDHYLIKPIDCSILETLLELEQVWLADPPAASLVTLKRKQTCGTLSCSQ